MPFFSAPRHVPGGFIPRTGALFQKLLQQIAIMAGYLDEQTLFVKQAEGVIASDNRRAWSANYRIR